MRLYQDWYDQLKSSLNNKRRSLSFVFLSGQSLTSSDNDRLEDAFHLWFAFSYDKVRQVTDKITFDDYLNRFVRLWRFLGCGYPLDLFFQLMKELVELCRHESGFLAYRQVFLDYDYIGELVYDIIRPFLWRRTETIRFQALHGVLNFLNKIYLENDDLSEEGLRSWFQHESDLQQLPPCLSVPISADLVSLLDTWLGDWTPDLLEDGYFTGGSTADAGRSLYAKIHHPAITPGLALLLVKSRPDLIAQGPALVVKNYVFYSKWIQVPKSATSLREIAMETAALNYWQSSLDDSLRKQMRRSPLGKICSFEDQSTNRSLAIEGSLFGNLATIDLSKASDSVRYDHLNLFPLPLRQWLAETRSPVSLVDDQVVFLTKFAPMGSRLTFDVEQILFAAIGWLAEAKAGIPTEYRRLSVVGDDIVIETQAVPYLLDYLVQLGFKVNSLKSYWSGNFRESCGTFAYKGVDITDVALPRKPFNTLKAPTSDTCSWLCTLADRAYYNCNEFLRYFCIKTLLALGTPYFRDASIADALRVLESRSPEEWTQLGYYSMLSPAPTEWRMRRRKAPDRLPDYGYGQGKLLTPRSKAASPFDDDELYDIWLYETKYRTFDSLPRDESLRGLGVGHVALLPSDRWVTLSV